MLILMVVVFCPDGSVVEFRLSGILLLSERWWW